MNSTEYLAKEAASRWRIPANLAKVLARSGKQLKQPIQFAGQEQPLARRIDALTAAKKHLGLGEELPGLTKQISTLKPSKVSPATPKPGAVAGGTQLKAPEVLYRGHAHPDPFASTYAEGFAHGTPFPDLVSGQYSEPLGSTGKFLLSRFKAAPGEAQRYYHHGGAPVNPKQWKWKPNPEGKGFADLLKQHIKPLGDIPAQSLPKFSLSNPLQWLQQRLQISALNKTIARLNQRQRQGLASQGSADFLRSAMMETPVVAGKNPWMGYSLGDLSQPLTMQHVPQTKQWQQIMRSLLQQIPTKAGYDKGTSMAVVQYLAVKSAISRPTEELVRGR